MKTWEEQRDGRTWYCASVANYQAWSASNALQALRTLRLRLYQHGRADLVPQLGLAD